MGIQLIEHIEIAPGVMGGRPRIAGRRITVADIAMWHLRAQWSVERITEEFELTPGQVHAALSYYFDHRAEIDESVREDAAFFEEKSKEYPSLRDELNRLQSKSR